MSWDESADGGRGAAGAVPGGQSDETPGDIATAVEWLQPGQRVQAQVHGVVHWRGTVETVAVELGVLWIREDGLGERKLLNLREHQILPQDPGDVRVERSA